MKRSQLLVVIVVVDQNTFKTTSSMKIEKEGSWKKDLEKRANNLRNVG